MNTAALLTRDWGLDQRSQQRWHLVSYLKIVNAADQSVLGHLMDMTTEGFMLISEQPINVEQRFRLRVNVPNTEGGTQSIEFAAISIWNRPDSTPYFYNTGFSLIDPSPQVTNAIEQLITALKSTQGESATVAR